MSVEAIGIALSALTLLVIAATAAAAIVQLRHLRTSNQLNALLEILNQWTQPALQNAYAHFTQTMTSKINDPEFRKLLQSPGAQLDRGSYPEFLVMDLWEQVGTYVKYHLIDEDILLDIASSQIQSAWKLAAPAIELMRTHSGPATCENFEYLAVRALLWSKRHPSAYPSGMPRMKELSDDAPPA
jgi:hypothetical protein